MASTCRLKFSGDWRTEREGKLERKGSLVIDYDPGRLPELKRKVRDAEVWNIEVVIRFHPGTALVKGPLLEPVRASAGSSPTIGHRPAPFSTSVPADAQRVELWFRTWGAPGDTAEHFDSRHGQNYWFDVE